MKQFTSIILLTLSYLALTGCAAMFTGTSDNITIKTESKDTSIFVNNQLVGKGDAHFTVARKDLGNTTISVNQEGCRPAYMQVNGSFNVVTLLGLFVDYGIITILVVDGIATGAWQKVQQQHYYLNPICS